MEPTMPDTKVDPEPTPTPTATPTGTPTGARDAEIAPYVGLPWRAGLLLSISLWCYLAMSELSRLSGDRLDTNDRSRPFVQLLGPSWFLTSGTPSTSADARCIAALPNSTAGMATSRFPYVTPSGGVGPCRGRSGQQLVDGGYIEEPGTEGEPIAWWFYEDHRYSVKRLIAAAGYPADEITIDGR